MPKVERNQLCPCGSGKKFKKCHGGSAVTESPELPPEVWAALDQKRREMKAAEFQRRKQQGLGKPIISTVVNEWRVVFVGNTRCTQKAERWKTFHDFLSDHFLYRLSQSWLYSERKKPAADRHPIVTWFEQSVMGAKQNAKNAKGVYTRPMTGAISAYLNLAYNVYLIGHRTPAQKDRVVRRFVNRLKSSRSDDFTGVLFETYAAAAFLMAGFDLEFENERDGSTSHVEFVATHPATDKKFSVEVKSRNWPALAEEQGGAADEGRRLRVASKLNAALEKKGQHTRVVFIEVNVPDILQATELTGWPAAALSEIRANEKTGFPNGEMKPSAYVLVTNHAFHNHLDRVSPGTQILATGFHIPDFGPDVQFAGYKAVLESRERHVEMFDLLDSMKTHYEIPSSFDGDMPDLAFGDSTAPRLRFGQWYQIPNKDGTEVPGRLYDASVLEKTVYGCYELATGKHVIATCPLSDDEAAAYEKHPETFFGELRRLPATAETFTDLCDFFYGSYKNAARDRLLKFLSGAPDYELLERLTQKDLAITYAERCAWCAYNAKGKKAS